MPITVTQSFARSRVVAGVWLVAVPRDGRYIKGFGLTIFMTLNQGQQPVENKRAFYHVDMN